MAGSEPKALYAELMRPEAWPGGGYGLRCIETHVSWVIFADDFVYKIKKPVDLGFCDFRSLEARRRACEDEVRLNRRLSEDLHLGVVPIVRTERGVQVEAAGAPIEWAVKMRRMPEGRMLDVLLERGAIDQGMIEALIDVLLPFQAQADRGPEVRAAGAPERIAANAADNLEALAADCGSGPLALIGPCAFSALVNADARDLRELRPLMLRRVEQGFVREGHGDLHAGNICFERPRPTIYDALEFSLDLRSCDVASEIAFLAMDLDRRGFAAFGQAFIKRFAERSSDEDLRTLVPFYKRYRALVRSKVAALQAAQLEPWTEKRAALRAEAARALRLAASYLLPKTLFLFAGLPASGKSWLAARVDAPHQARRLRSDVLRKRLFDRPAHARPASEAERGRWYSPEATAATYAALATEAAQQLHRGEHVIIDAAALRRAERMSLRDLAHASGAAFALIWIEVPEAVARERLQRRASDATEASDADEAVRARLATIVEPPTDDELPIRLDGRVSPDRASALLLDALLAAR